MSRQYEIRHVICGDAQGGSSDQTSRVCFCDDRDAAITELARLHALHGERVAREGSWEYWYAVPLLPERINWKDPDVRARETK